jgi:DNA processing protein
MDDRKYWLALSQFPGIGIEAIEALLEAFGSIEAVFACRASQLADVLSPGSKLIEFIAAGIDENKMADELEWLQQPGNHMLTWFDADYPPLLREISSPPLLLYVHGNPEALSLPQLAIVGSRNPTAGGCSNAQAFAASLVQSGFTITSGLAQGIDGEAHRAAISAGGQTVAVMGTGLKRVYPAAHRELAHSIAGHGALVSEFPLDAPPRREHFPQRNRIIAGLSLGTLVVEAAVRSGSLITARLAGDFGREVFAIPGSIHSALSKGCHRLIQQGAKLVETADDIAEELGAMVQGYRQASVDAGPKADAGMNGEFDRLLALMGYDPVNMDALVERSGLTTEAISSMLLRMELEGIVEVVPGGTYQRNGGALARKGN